MCVSQRICPFFFVLPKGSVPVRKKGMWIIPNDIRGLGGNSIFERSVGCSAILTSLPLHCLLMLVPSTGSSLALSQSFYLHASNEACNKSLGGGVF